MEPHFDQIRRLPDGSIDLGFYIRRCHELRSWAVRRQFARFGERAATLGARLSGVLQRNLETNYSARILPLLFPAASENPAPLARRRTPEAGPR
jgi:hypothetical protein